MKKLFTCLLVLSFLIFPISGRVAKASTNPVITGEISTLTYNDYKQYQSRTGYYSAYNNENDYTFNLNFTANITAFYRLYSSSTSYSLSQWYDWLKVYWGKNVMFYNNEDRPYILLNDARIYLSDTYRFITINNMGSYLELQIDYQCELFAFNLIDYYGLSFFYYNSVYNNYLDIHIVPPTFTIDNSQNITADADIYSLYTSNVNLDLSLTSVNDYLISSTVSNISIGYGDEDIYSGTSFNGTANYKVNSYNIGSYYYQNNLTLTTFNSPSLINSYNWTFRLPSLTGYTDISEDYGLNVLLDLTYFNAFDSVNQITPSVSIGLPDYRSCDWYDLPCHIGNALIYLLYEFPLTKPITSLFLTLLSFITPFFDFLGLFTEVELFGALFFLFLLVGFVFWAIK